MQLYMKTYDVIFVPEEYIVQYFISRQEEQYNGERETKEKAFFYRIYLSVRKSVSSWSLHRCDSRF